MEPLAHNPPPKLLTINLNPIRSIIDPARRSIPASHADRFPARIVTVTGVRDRGKWVGGVVELEVRAV